MEYTADNIDGLLLVRHISKKIRAAGGRIKGPAKRTQEQTDTFVKALEAIIEKANRE